MSKGTLTCIRHLLAVIYNGRRKERSTALAQMVMKHGQ